MHASLIIKDAAQPDQAEIFQGLLSHIADHEYNEEISTGLILTHCRSTFSVAREETGIP